ncbi:ECF RNA polymerase sigma factor SigE [Gemmata obscuriglobus]|uniref:ECF RNA polymerase sigma factor SigE n=1 Tax=Gemmata obscuriglobus TaxID=114 RepID=A0A2Z3HA96_9BACT|nr:sigma-70 family RNA polymerase sigma factor [Gemmata obscuriglobus]AWM40566.1 hypothetical protein C1280_28685 [Gemmata obscuriglobus]QEG26175.1 ECF RNA polymerase sigma factor SigE [Gemmata obscuriglobus]VTS00808.1 (myosin heavy-chain) kinase : RNA polymerase sigma factor, sigma-70 family OS=Singulisphaera acidiphila (strain ATCC BAA-1392 / DSM 18658 / VKM B-2454 / MOB10) GN=Sinac_6419 PE=4 SV=1: Sigma70_r2: Sigma70_r4_2: WD40: WD40 [Gemmata obscuriglobus UQM 2246]
MSTAPATIGRLLASGLPSKISDADLVERFALSRDGDAFAELTRRHGRMVLAVARRAVQDQHLADDVAQAAFLVLARKAHALSRPDRLAGWLFGVTRRIARRAAVHQRREAEQTVPLTAGIAAPERLPMGGDLPQMLDEELDRLPEGERVPLVLCYLEGLTQDEAARACGWSIRTVRRRLAAGRERLRARLERRGVELGSALAALALAGDAGAVLLSPEAVPGSRATALARSEFRWVARGAAAGWCGGVVAVALAVAVATGSWSGPPVHSPAASVPAAPADLPEGAAVRLGSSALSHPGTLIQLRFSEDGTRLFSYGSGKVRQWDAKSGAAVPHQARDIKTTFGTTLLSLDQTKVVAPHVDRTPLRFSVREYDLATGKHTERFVVPSRTDPRGQDIGIGGQRFALSPNGSTLVEGHPHEAYLWDLKTGRVQHQLKFDGATTGNFLFSPDGKHLITAGNDDPSVRFWDTGTGKPSQVLTWNASSGVGRLAVSADGRWVAAVSNSHLLGTGTEVAVWDQTVPGPARVMMLADGFGLSGAVAFGPGGLLYVASQAEEGGATVVTKWDVTTGKQLARWAGPDAGAYGPTVVEVSPGGSTLAVGTYWGVIRLYDTRTGAEVGRPSSLPATVVGVAFDRTGRNVRVSGADGSNATWDAGTGALVSRRASPISLPPAGGAAPVVPSRDGRWVLTYALNERGALLPWRAELWDTTTGERKHSGGIGGRVKELISVPSGKHVAVLVESRIGRSVQVWDLAAGEVVPNDQPTIDMTKFQWAAFPDGKTLFLMNDERAVGYDVTTGQERFSWAVADHDVLGRPRPEQAPRPNLVRAVAVSPDEKTVAISIGGEARLDASKQTHNLVLVETRTGKVIRRLPTPETSAEWLVFSPDGKHVAGPTCVWDAASLKEVRRFPSRPQVTAAAFSPDGKSIATGHANGTALVWLVSGDK